MLPIKVEIIGFITGSILLSRFLSIGVGAREVYILPAPILEI